MKETIKMLNELASELDVGRHDLVILIDYYFNGDTSIISELSDQCIHWSKEVGNITNDFREALEAKLGDNPVVERVPVPTQIGPPLTIPDTKVIWATIKSVSKLPHRVKTMDGGEFTVSTMTEKGYSRLKKILNTKLDGRYVDPAVLAVSIGRQYNAPNTYKKTIMNYFTGDDWEIDYREVLQSGQTSVASAPTKHKYTKDI